MSRATDLLVLGGGPAGAALAIFAARRGLAVRLLERERFPREKVCGEFVSAEGVAVLRRLGVLPILEAAGGRWMARCRISDARGTPIDVDLPRLAAGREALGISRARMDGALLDTARAAGVEVRERWQAREPLFAAGRVRGVAARAVGSDRIETLRATLTVAADGRRSMLARKLGLPGGDPTRSDDSAWLGLATHLDARRSGLADRIELHLFDGGYAGLGAVEDGRINLCMLATARALRACGGSTDRLLAERVMANPAVRAALGDSTVCAGWQAIGPLRFGARQPAAAGALFVGDAAGTVDPFCGEGMSHALIGAERATDWAAAAVERGGLDDDLAEGWRREWTATFGTVTRRVRGIGRLFAHPGLAGPALRLLRGPARVLAPRLVAATRTGWAP